jgi:Tfp pilus assembly pilus retraction ATPase PilT
MEIGDPDYVNVMEKDDSINRIPWKIVKEHEEAIIEDNIAYGLKIGSSERELRQYQAKAKAGLSALRKAVRENADVILVLDRETERFIVKPE